MKLALLAPAGAMHRYNGSFTKTLQYAPLTLTSLASLVPSDLNIETVLFDETVEPIPLDLECDIIAMTCITGTAPRCYAFADYFRKKGITVVLGGVHPSLMPQEAAEHADSVMTGFSEQTFPEMLYDFSKNELKRLYRQNCDYTIANKPIPSRHLLKKGSYITTATVEVIRGCAHPCTFCAYPAAFGRVTYPRPVEEVISELRDLKSKIIVFPDVNLIADVEYAKKLFTAMIPLKKYWLGLVTSTVGLDDELITLFRKSGCKGLLIGFESIVEESQGYVRKVSNRFLDYKELMNKLHSNGILVQGCFAFGGDEEDVSIFERTAELVLKTKIDLPRYSVLTPFPGTELYRSLQEQDRITQHNWALYDVEHVVFRPAKMTQEQLMDGITFCWKETYDTKNILRRLAPFRHSPWLSLPLNLGYKKYADRYEHYTAEVMCDNSDIPSEV